MKTAIQFGAGNIGRGFIGAVLSEAGYRVVFADVVEELLNTINTRGEYVVHVTDTESRDILIRNISAVNSASDAAVKAVVKAEIITTAVGLRILKFVAPTIAKGLAARKEAGVESPLNIVACENGLRATSQLKELVFNQIDPSLKEWAEAHVGWPDAAVDRIVPPVRCDMPLDVAVEDYFEWDVERSSFVGAIPEIPGMAPVDNLEAYVERKLFTLNTGHAAAAYLGKMKGLGTIGESIADPVILPIVREVMQQSGEGLVRKFGFDHSAHFAYIEKILRRFSNPYLKDDVLRVGREPIRKLAPNDRLILPVLTAKGFSLPYDKILLAIGAALHFNNPEDPQSVELLASIASEGLEATVVKYTGLLPADPLVGEIVRAYKEVEAL
ncbi:MAG: mannitol-1-phosphate 5-dehydrogenase [Bacteroidales bacterium]|nr:mannitol-1-phosphate 5-dehydrogenase [Bacteroidales bacterium]